MDIKNQFSASLNQQLISYYRRIPSASILARDFNSRAHGIMNPVTQETARRWIRGLSMPEMDKLQILIQWLDIKIDLSLGSLEAENRGNYEKGMRKKTVTLNEAESQLLQIFRETDIRGKRILLSVAKSLLQTENV
jgi:transcriptional regulator with XRE-family HTH domain